MNQHKNCHVCETQVCLEACHWGLGNATPSLFQQQREDTCCWHCRSCGEYQVRTDEYHCEDCAMGSLPSRDHSRCQPIPEEFIDYQNPWAIGAMAVASLGQSYVIFSHPQNAPFSTIALCNLCTSFMYFRQLQFTLSGSCCQ
jgi:hypothetical protein